MRVRHEFTDSQPHLTRRDLLHSVGGGFAGVALASLLNQDGLFADENPKPFRPGSPHHQPRAKAVIQLFMGGAASAVDLFDFKPDLIKYDGKPSDFFPSSPGSGLGTPILEALLRPRARTLPLANDAALAD